MVFILTWKRVNNKTQINQEMKKTSDNSSPTCQFFMNHTFHSYYCTAIYWTEAEPFQKHEFLKVAY